MKTKHVVVSPCPCGASQHYEQCCGRFHTGAIPLHAEQLMRSRYVAFVLRNAPYLLATWHASTRPTQIEFEPSLKWLGLTIVATQTTGEKATVEFIARCRLGGGSAARQHERSQFVLAEQRWWYVDGEQLS